MKILMTGANGQLGLAFQKELTREKIPFFGTDLSGCDITDEKQVSRLLDQQKPSVLINCAAYNLVDDAEQKPELAFAINSHAVKILAMACRERHVKFVHFGTDYVFDGAKKALYVEEDIPNPLNVYGQSKLAGEQNALSESENALIIRTSWLYGQGPQNFLFKVAQWAKNQKVLKVADDEVSVPTSAELLVDLTLRALNKKLSGLYHGVSSGYASRFELAKYFMHAAGLHVAVDPVPAATFPSKAKRPLFSAMSNRKISDELGIKVPVWQDGVDWYVRSVLFT